MNTLSTTTEPPTDVIDPDPVPLQEGIWALLNLIMAIATVIISLAMLILYAGKRKEEDEEDGTGAANAAAASGEDPKMTEIKRKGLLRLAGIIPAVVSVITFILTEDMSLPMAMTDKWTLLMAIILIVDIVIAILARKTKKDADDDDSAETAQA